MRYADFSGRLCDAVGFFVLNARAISALKAEYRTIQSYVARLVREMEASINEANQFIANMR